MKKLQSFAFCALVTPIITLGAGSALAQETNSQQIDRNQHGTQHDEGTMGSTNRSAQGDLKSQRVGQSDSYKNSDYDKMDDKQRVGQHDSQKASDHRKMDDKSRTQNRGHIASIPAQGMRASDLIDAEVSTASDKDVGPVEDLIIDENGQIVAIVVGVGGFLGMGEKNVAIGWDSVSKSGTGDDKTLKIDLTREDLRSAPEFEKEE